VLLNNIKVPWQRLPLFAECFCDVEVLSKKVCLGSSLHMDLVSFIWK